MATRRSLITRGGEKQNRLRVMSRAQKRAGSADDETRRNRRGTRTIHLAGHPAASNGAPIRLRQVDNQSAPLPCLPSFHTHGGRFTVQRNFLSSMRNFRGASFVFFFVISDAALSPGAFVCLVRYASALPRLAVASWLRCLGHFG